MSDKAHETCGDAKLSNCSDDLVMLFDESSEAVVPVETSVSVTPQSPTSENNSIQNSDNEDCPAVLPEVNKSETVERCDDVSLTSACVGENENNTNVCDEISESSVDDVKPVVSMQVISNENGAASSEVVTSGSVAENLTESYNCLLYTSPSPRDS